VEFAGVASGGIRRHEGPVPRGCGQQEAIDNKDWIMVLHVLENFRKLNRLFLIFVVAPVVIAIAYFTLFASDVYISESQFVVRRPESRANTGLGLALASAAGFSNAGEEAYVAKAFLESRDALRAINHDDTLRKAFTRDHIWFAERFDPIGLSGSFEDFYKYYQKHVTVETDVTTSISALTVRAYTAEDARRINEQLLRMSEDTVNQMNGRGRADMVRFAQIEVNDAKNQARAAGIALAAFRNNKGVVDPEVQATAQLEMISKLQDHLITTRAQVNQLRQFTPLNPQIPVLENRTRTLETEIRNQMSTLTGSDKSLAANSAQYQRLFLENQFADKQLAASLASLQDARNEARRQQVYVQRISGPNLPDAPVEPRRLRGVLATLALGLVAWGIASMLIAGIKEHVQ
jgi:capsular polysaccharide transport system permease protein